MLVDKETIQYTFSGKKRCHPIRTPGEAYIKLSFLAASGAVISEFVSGKGVARRDWEAVSSTDVVPPGTRAIRIQLLGEKAGGGPRVYFDDLSLSLAPAFEKKAARRAANSEDAKHDNRWTELLAGTSLQEWRVAGDKSVTWSIQRGVLSAQGGKSPSILHSEKSDFANVKLQADVMLGDGTDWGIFVGWETGGAGRIIKIGGGFNAETYSRTGDIGRQSGYRQNTVWLQNPPTIRVRKDEWFRIEIDYLENSIAVRVNGTLVSVHRESGIGKPGMIGIQCRPNSKIQLKRMRVQPIASVDE